MTAEKDKPPIAEKPYAVVPQFVLRNKKLSTSSRFLYAFICSWADKNGLAKVASKTLAIDAGVTERTIQAWTLELEMEGLIIKENDIGKKSVFRVIRFKDGRGLAQMKNVETVAKRRGYFSEFGKKGAAKRGKEQKEPPKLVSPPPETGCTPTGVKLVSPLQDLSTGLSLQEEKGGPAASPPNGGGGALKASLGDTPLDANSRCLQGGENFKSSPSLSVKSRGNIIKTGVDADEKRSGEARQKLAASLGWICVQGPSCRRCCIGVGQDRARLQNHAHARRHHPFLSRPPLPSI